MLLTLLYGCHLLTLNPGVRFFPSLGSILGLGRVGLGSWSSGRSTGPFVPWSLPRRFRV